MLFAFGQETLQPQHFWITAVAHNMHVRVRWRRRRCAYTLLMLYERLLMHDSDSARARVKNLIMGHNAAREIKLVMLSLSLSQVDTSSQHLQSQLPHHVQTLDGGP